jgi:hypothetical protein
MCQLYRSLCCLWTCLSYSSLCRFGRTVLQQPVLPRRVCPSAVCVVLDVSVLLQPAKPLDVSVQHQPVQPLDVSVLQQPVKPWTSLSYSSLCSLWTSLSSSAPAYLLYSCFCSTSAGRTPPRKVQ